jgi:hypothetical protein
MTSNKAQGYLQRECQPNMVTRNTKNATLNRLSDEPSTRPILQNPNPSPACRNVSINRRRQIVEQAAKPDDPV